MTGADIVVECMIEQGVDTVFGYPGGTILNIYDSLYRYSDKINHVLTAHEQGAAHAADGYARSSGKVGVVFATSGPGATNLVTGIATAYMDSIPMVAITCNVVTPLLGKDTFQEVDIVGVTMPITKHNFLVKRAEDIAPAIRAAFTIAASGRQGPVLVDITKDATANEAEYTAEKPKPIESVGVLSGDDDFHSAAEMIARAERPLIYAGGGVISSGASAELKQLQSLVHAPVALSLMGIGAYPADDEAFTGMIGMHGTKTTSLAVRDCDLIIAVGARFSDRVTCDTSTFAKRANVLHIDIDRAEIDKNIKTNGSLIGDAKTVLQKLCEILPQQKHDGWMEQVEKWKKTYPVCQPESKTLTPQVILEKINDMAGDNALLVTDVGQHQIWAAQFYKINNPRHFITSGGLGTMGFGLGAAVGAQVANPDKTVINITGDGCFHMNMQELSTAAKQELPIIEVVMNNNVLGMVRQWQRLFYSKRFSSTTLDKKTDYELVAKGLGANAFTATNEAEIEQAMTAALKSKDTPTLINCIIDPDQTVLPMVPSGQSIEEPILEIEAE